MTDNKELRELEEDIEFAKNYLPEALDVKFKVNTNIKFGIVKGDLTLRFLEKVLTQARKEARQECIDEIRDKLTELDLTTSTKEGRVFVAHIEDILDRLTDHSLLLEKEGKIPRKLQDKNGK